MKSLGLFGAALLVALMLIGTAKEANAQVAFYASRPVFYRAAYPYYGYPNYSYSYYGGWYPGSYMNNYGNYGSYHVMTPIYTGGYGYRPW